MKKSITLLSAILLVIALFSSDSSYGQMKMEGPMASETKAGALKSTMRKLWEDHIVWTRNVIFCLVDDLPGKDQALKRLMHNQVEIGNAVKIYYGEAAGNELTRLLKEHISQAADVVVAAKSGNTSALSEANRKWYENGDEISVFLSKANPKLNLADMKMMMNEHLKFLTDEAVTRIKKDYDGDVVAYDKTHDSVLKMADMLSYGIVKQFPEQFKTTTGTPK